MLVIADLLGCPRRGSPSVHRGTDPPSKRTTGGVGQHRRGHLEPTRPSAYLYKEFTTYIEERRRTPRDDVLTGLATATFPDGSIPEIIDVVRVAANLFAAGQETTVRLLGSALQMIATDQELQQLLRNERHRIPNFVEEMLRTESPVKGDFRLTRVPTKVGDMELPAGTTVMLVNAAANRDPRRFEDPATFDIERENARHHMAFGRGSHTCPGAPLARTEARVSIERHPRPDHQHPTVRGEARTGRSSHASTTSPPSSSGD